MALSNSNISTIILTHNEDLHLERCVKSVRSISNDIFIIDSYSEDDTLRIAIELGCRCFQNKWPGNHAQQFNWALENLPIKTDWVLRLDADEYLLPELVEEIKNKLTELNEDITGIIFKRRVYFMSRWIRNGGYYPTYLLRLWRFGFGKFENRLMDEHVIMKSGKSLIFDNDFVDDNLNNLSWWTDKHNNYSTREAIEFLIHKYNLKKIDSIADLRGGKTEKKRWMKENFYYKLPLFIRPFLYYIYRYIFKLGFLDGKEGFIFHFLQGFWYRFLVDAKIYQIESLVKKYKKPVNEIIEEFYKIEI